MSKRRGRRGTPYPAPSKEGAFTFVQNLGNCLESQVSKVLLFDVQRAGSGRWIGMAEKAPKCSGLPQNSRGKFWEDRLL